MDETVVISTVSCERFISRLDRESVLLGRARIVSGLPSGRLPVLLVFEDCTGISFGIFGLRTTPLTAMSMKDTFRVQLQSLSGPVLKGHKRRKSMTGERGLEIGSSSSSTNITMLRKASCPFI